MWEEFVCFTCFFVLHSLFSFCSWLLFWYYYLFSESCSCCFYSIFSVFLFFFLVSVGYCGCRRMVSSLSFNSLCNLQTQISYANVCVQILVDSTPNEHVQWDSIFFRAFYFPCFYGRTCTSMCREVRVCCLCVYVRLWVSLCEC